MAGSTQMNLMLISQEDFTYTGYIYVRKLNGSDLFLSYLI